MARARAAEFQAAAGDGGDTVIAQPLILLSLFLLLVAVFAVLTAHGVPRADREAAAVAGVQSAFAAVEVGEVRLHDPAAALAQRLQGTGAALLSQWQIGASRATTTLSGSVVLRVPMDVAFVATDPAGPDAGFPRLNHEALELGFALLAGQLADPRFAVAIELPAPAERFADVGPRERAQALLLAAQLVAQGAPRQRVSTGFADLPVGEWQLRLVPIADLQVLEPVP